MSANRKLSVLLFDGKSYNQVNTINIVGGPHDCDWSRWAMVYGQETFRVYCFKQDTNDTIYQFGYNPNTQHYEFGYNSEEVLKIIGVPATANTFTFSMLYDESHYRLYFLDINKRDLLHQFVFNGANYVIEKSNPQIRLEGMPKNIDASRMSMLYSKGQNQNGYHVYGFEQGKRKFLVQGYYDTNSNTYKRVNDVEININLITSDISSFSMLNDGEFWCYFLDWMD